MSTALAVSDLQESPESPLAQIAESIQREFALIAQAGESMHLHRIRCGQQLNEAKRLAPYGHWMQWVAENVDQSYAVCCRYMRLAKHQEKIDGSPSFEEALGLIRGAERNEQPGKALRDEGRRLRGIGMTRAEIAATLSVHPTTVTGWCATPETRERRRRQIEQFNARRREQSAAIAALKRQEREKAIQVRVKAGDELAEVYQLLNRTDSLLGEARRKSTDKTQRVAISEIHALRDQMMDALVHALGV